MPPKSTPLTQAAIHRMIKESVNVVIAAEQARHANTGNDARGSRPVRGAVERWFERSESVFGINECVEGKKVEFAAATLQGPALTWWNAKVATIEGKKVEFAAATLQGPALTWWNAKVATIGLETVNQMPWTKMKQLMTAEFNELDLMCPRMVEPESVNVDAYIQGLIENIKGEVTSSKLANLNEAMCMAHKLMEQNSQARDERILEGKKRNAEKVSSGPLPVCECCFTRHVGQCTIKCQKCGKVGHKARKVKQEETGEVHGRAYAIKDAEPQGPNVVTSTFLLNNCYASVLFDSGFDKSFVDTRFSSIIDIDLVKIDASYEVELADGRVISTNTVLKGCTLN
nr:hypothetical protein [Tanacetum cinerariifolium]